jgi:type I restriction enzyme M protein
LLQARNLREVDEDVDDEIAALNECLDLIEVEDAADKAVKNAQAKLDAEVLAHYAKLTADEGALKTLVVDDKWLATMQAAIVERYFAGELAAITSEVQRLTQGLAGRVKELEERYAHPLPELEQEVERLSAKVEAHLKQMGLVWR